MTLVDDYTADLLQAKADGVELGDAMRALTLKHAEHLRTQAEISVMRADHCPRCSGRLIAGDETVRCAAGCGFVYRARTASDPIASRRADP